MKKYLNGFYIKLLLILPLMCLCLYLGGMNKSKGFADGTSHITMIDGASVRFGEASGIRFGATVDMDYYNALEGDKRVGMYIYPYVGLNGEELNEDITAANDVKTIVWNADGESFNSVLYDIPDSYYGVTLAARAYIKCGDVYEWSEDTILRSIAQVASMGLCDEDVSFTESQTADLKNYVDKTVSSFALDDTSCYVAEDGNIDLSYSVSSSSSANVTSNLSVKFESDNDSVVTVDENGKITGVSAGIATVSATLGSKQKSVEVIVPTNIIGTAAELDSFISTLSSYGTGGSNNQSSAMYVVLSADIDYGGGNLITNTSRASFQTNWCGYFNGFGHVISNMTVDRGGLFGYLRGGTVKNLGLVNITSSKSASDTGGLLAMMATGGTENNAQHAYSCIDNCFVQGQFANASLSTGAGVVELAYSGHQPTHCIASVYGAKYAISGQEASTFGTPSLSYAFSSAVKYAYKDDNEATHLFDTMATFTNGLTALPGTGWSSYWNVSNGSFGFGSYSFTDYRTHVIKSAEDLDNFIKILDGYGNGKENLQSSSMYVVLANDINYNNGNLITNTGRKKIDTNWCGVFDGCGHTISNLTVDRGGVFGYIRGGTVKNLGLVNITSNKAAGDTGGLLCMMLTASGTVNNCFVEGQFTNASDTTGGGIAEFSYSGCTISNCVTVVEGAKWSIAGQETGLDMGSSCHSVSSSAVYAYRKVATNAVLSRTISDFISIHKTGGSNWMTLTPARGWQGWWNVTSTQIVFGDYTTSLS